MCLVAAPRGDPSPLSPLSLQKELGPDLLGLPLTLGARGG